jgi:radical SAM superfamily enzyme YgiQ (UPF0313 family)
MRFLWLDINASFSHSSLALPALEAQLSDIQRGCIEWQVEKGTIKSDLSACLLNIIKYSPDYLFATLWLFNHKFVLSILKRVHALNPNIVIILGGPEFLGDNLAFLNSNPEVSAVFNGEGEDHFSELVKLILEGGDWRGIEGMCSIDRSGQYRNNGKAVVKDFASLRHPESSIFFNWDKPFIQIETSRGCFNGCKFCISGADCQKIVNVPIELLRARLNIVRNKGIKEVRILDRTFNANPARAIELLNLFEEFDNSLQFHLEIHPSFLTEALRDKLNTITDGLLHIEVGIQSLDEAVIKSSGRIGSAKSSLDGLRFLVSTKKFEVHADLIAGLPLYTYKNLLSDLNILIDIGPDEIQLETLKVLSGTDLRENAIKFNIAYSPEPPYEILSVDGITAFELIRIALLSKVIDLWYNNKRWQKLFQALAREDEMFVENFLSFVAMNSSFTKSISLESGGLILYEFCDRYYEKWLNEVTEAWIKAGLSLNKKPGKRVKKWNSEYDLNITNPLYRPDCRNHSYYYLENGNKLTWFEFENTNRGAPPIKSDISFK